MHATTSRRFQVCIAAVLGTTLLPWAYCNLYLPSRWKADRAAAEEILKTASPGSSRAEEALRTKHAAEKSLAEPTFSLRFGLDLRGGASITYRVTAEPGQAQAEILKEAVGVIGNRLDRLGVSEVNLVESGVDQLTVELPGRGSEEINRIKEIMSRLGTLEFRIVATPDKTTAERQIRERDKESYVPTPGFAWYQREKGGGEVLLEVPEAAAQAAADATAKALAEAQAAGKPEAEVAPLRSAAEDAKKAVQEAKDRFVWTGQDLAEKYYEKTPLQEGGGGYEVHFTIVPGRRAAFGEFTGDNIHRQMAIVLNREVTSEPEIQSRLPGQGKISGHGTNAYTQQTAADLVTVLQSGSMRVKPEEISSFVVGPGLGEEAVRRGGLAMSISFLFVLGFMAWFYRGAGWVANLAVLLNLVMTLGILMFIGAALSLPGIAGLLLTVGMAVDANILVNERIREEKAAGKGLLQAVTAGYDRAFVTILDSNLTTILTAVILYWIGTGTIKGFALTLILGLATSMFTACYVTRTLFLWGLETGVLREFRMAAVYGRTNFRWMQMRTITFAVSLVLIVAGTAAFILRPTASKYDLEFTGGQRAVLAFRQRLTIDAVRARLESAGLGDVVIRTVRGRGVESAKLDLKSESDSFELTSRIRDEAEGREFTAKLQAAFAAELFPPGIADLTLGAKDVAGKVPFRFTANLAAGTKVATADQMRDALAGAAAFQGADLKVEAAETTAGAAASFRVAGSIAAAGEDDKTRFNVVTGAQEAAKRGGGISLSDPVPQSDFIGPGVARRLRDEAMLAILLSLLAQIVYLRLRFRDYTYGFAAAIALAHDVLITLGAVAVFDALGLVNAKINLPVIAAFLTLIGFSMNDTIVVFDRIRENLGRALHPDAGMIDGAINQTLARSIRTSITVFLVSFTLFAVNYGAASSLEGFGFVMTIGVLTGVYSSVAIAAPLLLFLPVYSERLRALGRWPTLALIASLFVGLALSFAADGVVAHAGTALACVLPIHWFVHVVGWLYRRDGGPAVPATA